MSQPFGHVFGRRLTRPRLPNAPPSVVLEIVGVVRDAVYRSLRDPAPPTLYLPLTPSTDASQISLSVRAASGAPSTLVHPLARTIGNVDRDLSMTFRPLARYRLTSEFGRG